ncbi:MAG: XRE family transcriptional regulator [Deltaproteobacteria bacterium]|jgi:antitoxin HicB|nr:XRE family transcriptional regulator [Deltaproteobacteria bacterium]MBW1796195.1 XRE family transcriptional regulator [Deltaproteobacteria bacterium]
MTNKHIGSNFDHFLEEEGLLEECTESAIKRVLAWQLKQEMEKNKLTKTALAKRMNTSRASLERLLDPTNESVTLQTMKKAASVLGRKLKLELV